MLSKPLSTKAGATDKPASPLGNKITRMRAADLDPILATMRLTKDNKRRVREYLVEGHSMRDIATADGVSPELVSRAVQRTRARINESINPWAQITISLTLPLQLAEELRGLSDGLSRMPDVELANSILREVSKSVAAAKAKVVYGA